jgi:Flp pilus assembly protein TadD
MSIRAVRALIVCASCLVGLTGCETLSRSVSLAPGQDQPPPPAVVDQTVTGSIAAQTVKDELQGGDPYDDLNLGKRHFSEKNYGLAEKHFRRAVEKLPRDGEAWLGLAASYDRLRRFDLADRAYKETLAILGPRPEVLNNIGYSHLLRGDFRGARAKFAEAQRQDPGNPYIANNIRLADEAARRRKGIQ